MNFTITLADAVAAAVGASAVAGIIALVKAAARIARSVSILVASDKEQTETLRAIAATIAPMLQADKASLEAHRDGRCNGNVKDALEAVDKASASFNGFLLARIGEAS
jgi:hypothetical protein